MKRSPILTIIAAWLSLSLPACNKHKEEQPKITVTSPESKPVTLTERYVCQIESHRHIDVRALKPGYLEAITIKEGQLVKQGDLLFKVIPILYQAKLDAENAEAKIAQLEFDYIKKLHDDKVISLSYDPLPQAKAKLVKAKAAVQSTMAELNFATIKAPFDGIVGRLQHQQGRLVQVGDVLTTLADNSAMWVYFNVPEARYLEYMSEHLDQHLENLQIELILANGNKFPHVGKLGAIEADFNHQTGTIPFRADFPNPDRLLRHGQTGTLVLHRVQPDALVIPERATFEVDNKRYVYILDQENVVHQREITIQNELDDLFVIKQGIGLDDKIVLDGIKQVRDGEKVKYEVN